MNIIQNIRDEIQALLFMLRQKSKDILRKNETFLYECVRRSNNTSEQKKNNQNRVKNSQNLRIQKISLYKLKKNDNSLKKICIQQQTTTTTTTTTITTTTKIATYYYKRESEKEMRLFPYENC